MTRPLLAFSGAVAAVVLMALATGLYMVGHRRREAQHVHYGCVHSETLDSSDGVQPWDVPDAWRLTANLGRATQGRRQLRRGIVFDRMPR